MAATIRRIIVAAIIIILCFLLQSTLFTYLSLGGVSPSLMVIVVSAFGFMRGRREGMFVGFFSGLLMDLFCGKYLGPYALLYMYVGYINGFFRRRFYPDDIRLPLVMIAASDLFCSLLEYVFGYLVRGRLNFLYYFRSVIVPELVYTLVVAIALYYILLRVNMLLEGHEQRSTTDFDT